MLRSRNGQASQNTCRISCRCQPEGQQVLRSNCVSICYIWVQFWRSVLTNNYAELICIGSVMMCTYIIVGHPSAQRSSGLRLFHTRLATTFVVSISHHVEGSVGPIESVQACDFHRVIIFLGVAFRRTAIATRRGIASAGGRSMLGTRDGGGEGCIAICTRSAGIRLCDRRPCSSCSRRRYGKVCPGFAVAVLQSLVPSVVFYEMPSHDAPSSRRTQRPRGRKRVVVQKRRP